MNKNDIPAETFQAWGIEVAVAFFEDNVASIMPMFGGYYASKETLAQYNKAAAVVKNRLLKLGWIVE